MSQSQSIKEFFALVSPGFSMEGEIPAVRLDGIEVLSDARAVAMVESALIFEAERQGTIEGWRRRFGRIILVTAPVELRIARYVERMQQQPNAPSSAELEADAHARLAMQIPDCEKIPLVDYVIHNDGPLDQTRRQAQHIYAELAVAARV